MDLTNREERLRRIAKHVNNVPTLPEVMSKIIELVEDPRTTAPQLARFISNDPALTAKILKLANSAFYGFPQRIGTINLAIVVLGFQSVKDLGLSAAVVETFTNDRYARLFNLNRFWVHSIAVAAGCKLFTQDRPFKVSGEMFVAGLLHDLGKLVLSEQAPNEYKVVVHELAKGEKTAYELEMEIFGFSHAELGGWIVERWNLPQHQAAAIYDHAHSWVSFQEPNLAMMVDFADHLARRAGFTIVDGELLPDLHPRVGEYLQLREDKDGGIDWNYYLERMTVEMARAKSFLKLLRNDDYHQNQNSELRPDSLAY